MRFAFYKKVSSDQNIKYGKFDLSISNLQGSLDRFYKKPDNNLPENIINFLDLSRKYLHIEELPFFVLSEEELTERTINSDFNRRVQQATGDSDTIYINMPNEADYVYSFCEDDFLYDEYKLESAFKRTKFPQFTSSKLVPLQIHSEVQSVKLLHSTSKNVKQRRYFLFIDNLLVTAKTLFTEYDPKLYEITKDLEDVLVEQIEKPKEMKTIALVIHGFMSKTEDNFKELKEALRNSNKYDRIFGYSYAPNKVCIKTNGKLLKDMLEKYELLNSNLNLDIYAHSEGGLVARSMIVHELSNCSHSIRNFITAGTPHKGTPFAKLGYSLLTFPKIGVIVSRLITFADPQTVVILKYLLYYYACFKENVGLMDMIPKSKFLKSLQKKRSFNIKGSVLLAGYDVGRVNSWSKRILIWIANKKIFKPHMSHDIIVPFKSSTYKFIDKKIYVFSHTGFHSDYYNKLDKAEAIVSKATSLP